MLFLAAATLLVVALPGSTQSNDPDNPKNRVGGENGRNDPKQDCVAHHRVEGMKDAFWVLPILPVQVVAGQEATGQVQIINMWEQDLRAVTLTMVVPEEESLILTSPGASSRSTTSRLDEAINFQGTYSYEPPPPPSVAGVPAKELNFTVHPDASRLELTLDLVFHDVTPGGSPPGVRARLFNPTSDVGSRIEPYADERATHRNLTLGENQTRDFPGTWTLRLEYQEGSGQELPGTNLEYFVNISVTYQQARTQEYELLQEATLHLPPRSSHVLTFPLLGTLKGTQNVTFAVRAEIYYDRQHDDSTTPNQDNYTRYSVSRLVRVGDTFEASQDQLVAVPLIGIDARLVAGELLGFVSAALLFPSLLLGGTYGRVSRLWLNRLLRGTRRRVEFHNLLSMGLVAAALLHLFLFFWEGRYSIAMGILWGGASALALLFLGLSGHYQVPLIQRYGYPWWRGIHLAFGLVVMAFVLLHSVADGADFAFVKKEFPLWFQEFNFAQK